MKTVIKFAVCCLGLITLTACGGGNRSGDNENTTEKVEKNVSERTEDVLSQLDKRSGGEYDCYQDACANKDFAAAHKMLADMKNKVEKMRQSTFTPRKKRKAAEREYREATEYVESEESKWIISIIETACEDQDFEKAHILNRELKKRCGIDYTKNVILKEAKYLASMNDEQASNRVLYLLKDIENQEDREYVAKQIYDLAISTGNEYLSKALNDINRDRNVNYTQE